MVNERKEQDAVARLPPVAARKSGRGKRYRLYGREFTLAELCRLFHQPRSTVEGRLKRGVPLMEALTINGRCGMDTKILELSEQYRALRDQKSELEVQLKKINAQLDEVTAEMIDIMTTTEVPSFNHKGATFSLVTQQYPAPEPERKGDLWEAMKANSFADLFTINSQTLTATLKELIAENEDIIPSWLEGLVKLTEKNSIRMKKNR